jgi:hypothetical protein
MNRDPGDVSPVNNPAETTPFDGEDDGMAKLPSLTKTSYPGNPPGAPKQLRPLCSITPAPRQVRGTLEVSAHHNLLPHHHAKVIVGFACRCGGCINHARP